VAVIGGRTVWSLGWRRGRGGHAEPAVLDATASGTAKHVRGKAARLPPGGPQNDKLPGLSITLRSYYKSFARSSDMLTTHQP
jgi:hypothetical protein